MEKKRVILHSDLNNFFASVEIALNPSLKGKAVAVCGSEEDRHGIVLAKSEQAKKYGVKTTMTIVEAKRLCPNLLIVQPHHEIYQEYSLKVRKIYERFTDRIEPFGIDEAWLDVTNSIKMFGSGENIANLIREAVKTEVGLTCSVGVSFNKVFAKLGSDLKKPDATSVIDENNYKKLIWRLPVGNLLYVGKSTLSRLNKLNICTIGDLANTPYEFIISKLGKWGEQIWQYARGEDDSSVKISEEDDEVKSVGNSITPYRDLKNINDVKTVLTHLCETVSERVIRYGIGKARTVTLSIRDESLNWISRQTKLEYPSVLSEDYFNAVVELFIKYYDWHSFVHSIGVSVSDFCGEEEQLCMGQNVKNYEKKVELEKRVNQLRKKYGNKSLHKGTVLGNENFTAIEKIQGDIDNGEIVKANPKKG